MRGYYGIAVYQPKCEPNLGTMLRSAHNFGAAFIALIGARYRKQVTDTTDATRHVPLFAYEDMDDFLAHRTRDCGLGRCEGDGRTALPAFTHHPRAIYLFGGEDKSVPAGVGERGLRIETPYCLNLAVAASVVMYDRSAKGVKP